MQYNGMFDKITEKNFEEDQYVGVKGFILEIIKIVVLAFVIIFPIRVFLFQPFFVQGASMEPNFEDGEYLIINELGYKRTEIGFGGNNLFVVEPFKDIKRQQAIVFRYPLDERKFFIKRIIALPGEKIEIKNGQVKIYNSDNPNGLVLDESAYLDNNVKTNGNLTLTLREDEYFVMGDNRMFSSDSRSWGTIREEHIVGLVLLRAWPLNRIDIY